MTENKPEPLRYVQPTVDKNALEYEPKPVEIYDLPSGGGAAVQTPITLPVEGWTDGVYETTVSGLGGKVHMVSPADGVSSSVWAKAGLWFSNPSGDMLRVEANTPITAPVNVIVTIF